VSDRLGDQAALLDAVRVQTMQSRFLRNASPSFTRVTTGSAADGAVALTFNIARPWAFVQRSTGASTRLQLQDLSGGKTFEIGSADGTKRACIFGPSDTAGNNWVNLIPDGGYVQIGGKSIVLGANDSFSPGYRTVCIANA
jgi:hypothetical protein